MIYYFIIYIVISILISVASLSLLIASTTRSTQYNDVSSHYIRDYKINAL